MKTTAAFAAFAASTMLAATVSAQTIYSPRYDSRAALQGAATGIAIAALLTNTRQYRVAHPYPYAQQVVYRTSVGTVVVPTLPIVVSPQPRACNTARVPVFDGGGRLIEYVQVCAD